MGHSRAAECRPDEGSPLNHRDYLVLGLTAVVAPIVMVASLVGGQFGPATVAFIVLVIAVTLIFIGANKDVKYEGSAGGDSRPLRCSRQRRMFDGGATVHPGADGRMPVKPDESWLLASYSSRPIEG